MKIKLMKMNRRRNINRKMAACRNGEMSKYRKRNEMQQRISGGGYRAEM
jgi:hypothetical protein